ncbi:hypothetical protein DsansV1_C34g0224641 [Dioscorea sansibarensis]
MEGKRKYSEGIPECSKRIRLLRSWLPSIMEEEEGLKMNADSQEAVSGKTETVLAVPSNEEKELVLYEAVEEPLLNPSILSNLSLKISPQLIASLKSRVFWPRNPYPMVVAGAQIDNTSYSDKTCGAIIPWMPSNALAIKPPVSEERGKVQLPGSIVSPESRGEALEDPMETEEGEDATMEVEEDREHMASLDLDGKGLQQWPQQQCMPPQLQQTTLPAILWSQQ